MFDLNPEQDFCVLSFNFEMLARRLVGRKFSSEFNYTVKELYSSDKDKRLTQEQIGRFKLFGDKLSRYPIYYVDITGNITEIMETIARFLDTVARGKKVLISLDHSILVKKSLNKNQMETLYDLMEGFNMMKKVFPDRLVFLLVSQLNRDIEQFDRRKDATDLAFPIKSDCFGSDSLYMYSDTLMITHCPYNLGIKFYGHDKHPTAPDLIFWHFIKCRDANRVLARMKSNFKYMKIEEL